MVLANITGIDHNGDLVAVPAEWDIELDGPVPAIHLRANNRGRSKSPSAKVGDTVLIRIDVTNTNKIKYNSGRILKIVGKAQTKLIGVYKCKDDQADGIILPVEIGRAHV